VTRALVAAAAVALLNASLSFQNIWPTPAIRWEGELSIELADAPTLGIINVRAGDTVVVMWLSHVISVPWDPAPGWKESPAARSRE